MGRAGSMHVADFSKSYFGGNGIVGASVGIGMGAALAARELNSGQVVLSFFGDGGVNTGRVWEAINLATVWRLPLVVFCENNLYAVETRTAEVTGGSSIVRRAEGFGLPAISVDGQDVTAVYRTVRDACGRARGGEGPTFIEGVTYRYQGHNTGQVIRYRTKDEVDWWRRSRDPIDRLHGSLVAAGLLDTAHYDALNSRARELVRQATAFADESPWPDLGLAASGVTEIDPRLTGNV
jgi:TPP-dependent pyruvate/acetoin dehydrogenase alpha subunit